MAGPGKKPVQVLSTLRDLHWELYIHIYTYRPSNQTQVAKDHLSNFFLVFFGEGLSLQAKQRSAPPKKPRACLSQAPTKRGVCASLPAALLPVDATHVAAVPSTPAAISAKPPAVARPTGV
jgi:hypothetical protein